MGNGLKPHEPHGKKDIVDHWIGHSETLNWEGNTNGQHARDTTPQIRAAFRENCSSEKGSSFVNYFFLNYL